MRKTYTLYLRDGGEPDRFVPAMCWTDVDAIRRATTLLAENADYDRVEISFGPDLLFTICHPMPD